MAPPRLRLPPPPPDAQCFRTDALDQLRALVALSDGEHSRVVHGKGRLGYQRHVMAGRRISVAWGGLALAQTLRGRLASPTLHVPFGSGNTYAFGRRKLDVDPGAAMFVAPGWEFTRRSEPGQLFAMTVDEAALAAEIDARCAGMEAPLRSRAVSPALTSDVVAAIADLIEAPDRARATQVREQGEARVVSAMADVLLRGTALPRSAPMPAARLASLESWIDAHLCEPITLGELCKASGVGARSLQHGFASRRGVSPMRFVAERRLAESRRRLMHAEPHEDVTRIAVSVGFTHLGRFSVLYRQAFGESPSQTLRS